MGERQDHNLVAPDLIRDSEGKAIQYGESTVWPISPLRGGFGKPEDCLQHRFDLVFELGPQPDAARLVVVDLVIDLSDREAMDSKLQRRVRPALR